MVLCSHLPEAIWSIPKLTPCSCWHSILQKWRYSIHERYLFPRLQSSRTGTAAYRTGCPVPACFGGSTAFLLLKGFWQHGNKLQHIAAPLLLLICPAISLFLLLKIQTSRTADTTDKFVEDLCLTMKTHPPTAAHFSFCPAL